MTGFCIFPEFNIPGEAGDKPPEAGRVGVSLDGLFAMVRRCTGRPGDAEWMGMSML